MTVRVAFVDIDGCIVDNGKLNRALVEQLRTYDHIILFTQRSIFLQESQISHRYFLDSQKPAAEEIVNTPDVVNALTRALDKPIKVSTSLDFLMEKPTQYYETVLKNYENELKNVLKDIEEPEDYKPSKTLTAALNNEIEQVRANAKALPTASPSEFYPKGKVAQCQALIEALPDLLDTTELIEIDYYDDHIDNLNEVENAAQDVLSLKPHCIIVSDAYICPLAKFKEEYGVNAAPTDKTVREKLAASTIAKLGKYRIDRRQEQLASQSEYHTFWARIFRPAHSATVKLQAAEKAIRILQGDPNVSMSSQEISAIQQGRLKALLGESLNQVLNSVTPASPRR